MKKISFIFMLSTILVVSHAQNKEMFRFVDKSGEMEIEVPEYAQQHYLGEEFTKKFYALKEKYVYRPEASFNSPTPASITEKPSIYNSLKKLDKYYKKQLKKGTVQQEEVRASLSKALAVGYSIRYADTSDLETILWKTKDIAEIEKIFTEKIVLN
ncbi:MAG: hypothetical protein MJA30_25015 [Cytophagales bacterium]|nr:hypothetical protein [Cytophagales bacterium]